MAKCINCRKKIPELTEEQQELGISEIFELCIACAELKYSHGRGEKYGIN